MELENYFRQKWKPSQFKHFPRSGTQPAIILPEPSGRLCGDFNTSSPQPFEFSPLHFGALVGFTVLLVCTLTHLLGSSLMLWILLQMSAWTEKGNSVLLSLFSPFSPPTSSRPGRKCPSGYSLALGLTLEFSCSLWNGLSSLNLSENLIMFNVDR